MKKWISVLITTMLLLSCLGMTAFAKKASATISDDFQKLYLDGNSYSRFDTSMLEIEYYETLNETVTLSAVQQETVKSVILDGNEYRNIISATISYKDGATLSVEFLRDDYLNTYEAIINGENNKYIIDFEWPEGNTVTAKKTSLLGNSVTLSATQLEWCDYYKITVQSIDGYLTVQKGALIIINDQYYYVDFSEAGIENWEYFAPYDFSELSAYKISDASLCDEIKEAEDAYYADDMGFLFDDDFTETISTVFLIFAFAFIPLVIFVVFLFLAFRSKTVYRKLFTTICILSVTELTVFVTIAAFMAKFR